MWWRLLHIEGGRRKMRGDGQGYMSNSLGRHQLASGTKANMIFQGSNLLCCNVMY